MRFAAALGVTILALATTLSARAQTTMTQAKAEVHAATSLAYNAVRAVPPSGDFTTEMTVFTSLAYSGQADMVGDGAERLAALGPSAASVLQKQLKAQQGYLTDPCLQAPNGNFTCITRVAGMVAGSFKTVRDAVGVPDSAGNAPAIHKLETHELAKLLKRRGHEASESEDMPEGPFGLLLEQRTLTAGVRALEEGLAHAPGLASQLSAPMAALKKLTASFPACSDPHRECIKALERVATPHLDTIIDRTK